MTSEIVIMNRHAIVLAADSATTVTRTVKGKREERYFKGANKIFQLSSHHPVGVMIYNSADLHGVPWEILIKDFRQHIGDKQFSHLEGYVDEFFEYIASHAHIFPADVKEQILLSKLEDIFWEVFVGSLENNYDKDDKISTNRKNLTEYLSLKKNELDSEPTPECFGDEQIAEVIQKYQSTLVDKLEADFVNKTFLTKKHVSTICRISFEILFKRFKNVLSPTGIVFAGYGENEFYPRYIARECFGFVLDKIVETPIDSETVSNDKISHIKPFATSSMINTFMMGFSPDVYGNTSDLIRKTLKKFAEDMHLEAPNLDELVEGASKTHVRDWVEAAVETHYVPLGNVIGALPLDEMAELAETLVNLQSLKEKVTKPSESVGGPIDVAVISKADGFIWIKRKHYFDGKLNGRFFSRQQKEF
ncbi:hypothetical protein HED22_15985 [Thalassospira sp. HF15]|uniref:hypothetical protein n=1 Tax=Thalassospira sp. HF15 TaxID=2722755 RepID=UPI001431A1E3|nr:hypothetical protein [Thalassospira sp. HF15]NIY77153.1 hypothetical protein [Thalassospira sp. HF15]